MHPGGTLSRWTPTNKSKINYKKRQGKRTLKIYQHFFSSIQLFFVFHTRKSRGWRENISTVNRNTAQCKPSMIDSTTEVGRNKKYHCKSVTPTRVLLRHFLERSTSMAVRTNRRHMMNEFGTPWCTAVRLIPTLSTRSRSAKHCSWCSKSDKDANKRDFHRVGYVNEKTEKS